MVQVVREAAQVRPVLAAGKGHEAEQVVQLVLEAARVPLGQAEGRAPWEELGQPEEPPRLRPR